MTTTNSGGTKRAWKLQEFVAHGASVNCLALGHKSGRVLVTGGDDKKVNLWAVGKPNCIMSLGGHTTPVECVRFGHTEELVCAGSASGALKIWDLEAARLVRTLTGHKSNITCIDFHPYGDFLSSGSGDTNLKLWDIRRRGCIFTYKGHSQTVNCLKFSPDGQWVASGGEEGAVKIWDLRAGKMMTEFNDHSGAVYDVEFHPHEFLLASASADKTINFWDLEAFNLVSKTEKDSGPVRAITFHSEGNCFFSGSPDTLKVHTWEPNAIRDTLIMGWGKIRDISIASTQLIGAAFQMSNVSLYVVDLKRVQPFAMTSSARVTTVVHTGQEATAGHVIRRSFVTDQNGARQSPKVSEEQGSDKSGTDPEDSEENFSQADITDYQKYEQIFRPRRRELNRTPPPPEEDEPFQAPPDDVVAPPMGPPVVVTVQRPAHLRVKKGSKKPSPSPTRRQSQPAPPGGYGSSPVRMRRGSNPTTPTGGIRPSSVYEGPNASSLAAPAAGSRELPASPIRYRTTPTSPMGSIGIGHASRKRSASVQTRNQPQQQPKTENRAPSGSGDVPERSSSVNRPGKLEFTSLTPVSRIQISQQQQQQQQMQMHQNNGGPSTPPATESRPLDRPTLVRPQRTSTVIIQNSNNASGHQPDYPSLGYEVPTRQLNSPPVSDNSNHYHAMPRMPAQQQNQMPDPQYYPPPQQQQQQLDYHQQLQQQQLAMQSMALSNRANLTSRMSEPVLHPHHQNEVNYMGSRKISGSVSDMPEKEKIEVIPMNLEKPTGLEMGDFLPMKFQMMGLGGNTLGGSDTSKFSAFKSYGPPTELSESEVTSSILKGHESMMAALTNRGRQMEIIQKLWQSKDAKTAVDQAVALNDQSVLVDLLTVITLRPSIWNLDLCTALLPPIEALLQSKYEMYITVGCGAMKLILKNFASVIKSNIDSPIQTVGVDISREERHNKCMECYKDLVKIRSLIFKRQAMQGKLGHTFRELSILMQYLD